MTSIKKHHERYKKTKKPIKVGKKGRLKGYGRRDD